MYFDGHMWPKRKQKKTKNDTQLTSNHDVKHWRNAYISNHEEVGIRNIVHARPSNFVWSK